MSSRVEVNIDNCKGCGLCIKNCPTNQLMFTNRYNSYGFNYIESKNNNCTGCALCYYSCPEPDAIVVHKNKKRHK